MPTSNRAALRSVAAREGHTMTELLAAHIAAVVVAAERGVLPPPGHLGGSAVISLSADAFPIVQQARAVAERHGISWTRFAAAAVARAIEE